MKILFAGHNSLLSTFVDEVGKDNEVTVLYSNRGVYPTWKNVKIIVVNYAAFGTRFIEKLFRLQFSAPSYISNLRKNIEQEQPNVVVVFDFFRLYFWQFVWLLRKDRNVRLYLYSETKTFPRNIFSRILFKSLLYLLRIHIHRIEKILVFTPEGKRFFNSRIPEANVEVMPVPVNTDIFIPETGKTFMNENVLRIIMNARFVDYKCHRDLVIACARLKEIRNLDFHLTFIGRASNGYEVIKRLVGSYGLNNMVTFLDPVSQSDMVHLYNRQDLLVLPSYNEAVGMVVPEAMACGIPTITSDTVGANVYVKEGETGLVFKTNDVDELLNSLLKIIDKQKLERMGAAARHHMETQFSVRKVSQKFLRSIS